MIYELFTHLNLKDLAACSMVNKRWHSIYAGFRVHRLAATAERYDHKYFIKWSYPDRMVREERCAPAAFIRFAGQPLLSSLKQLALADVSFKFDLNKLNAFRQLAHLEINIEHPKGIVKLNLNLPRLKVLALRVHLSIWPLSIDCPELRVLGYLKEFDKSLLYVNQPETIRILETSRVGSELSKFKNVECLVTTNFEAISKVTLLSLPKLKELRYNESIRRVFIKLYNDIGTADQVRQTLREFLGDVRVLRGADFRFRFAGFRLTQMTLDQFVFSVHTDYGEEDVFNEDIYLKNHRLIDPDDPLEFVTSLDYTLLMSCVAGEIPSGFFEKFVCVVLVKVKGAPDSSHLLAFLKELRSLKELELNNVKLGQEFYDRLPASARSLNLLELRGDKKDQLQLSFDFVSQLSHLSRFYTRYLSFDSFKSLARHLGKFKLTDIRLIMRGREFRIWKVSKEWYVHDEEFWQLLETEDSDEVANFFEAKAIEASD